MDAELDVAGELVRAAYLADGLATPRYLAIVADARGRARHGVVAVAVDAAGTLVGSVTYAVGGSPLAQVAGAGQAEFRMLGVTPAARGRGIGAALVAWCVDRARADGMAGIAICSATAMRAAHRLYTGLGFTRRPELDWSPESGVELWGFGLALPSAGRAPNVRR
jgi:GNAT superfamily N-acetyltransferase